MSILEQHFYTDAGVNLPVNKSEKNDKKIPKLIDLKNATDDVKVNLHKINKEVVRLKISKSDSVINQSSKINKRHSSVFPLNDNEEQHKKMLNRRSLSEIPTKEMSRIPISSKCFTSRLKNDDFTSTSHNNNEIEINASTEVVTNKASVPKQRAGSCIPCFKNNLASSNKENLPKTTSSLPVLMK